MSLEIELERKFLVPVDDAPDFLGASVLETYHYRSLPFTTRRLRRISHPDGGVEYYADHKYGRPPFRLERRTELTEDQFERKRAKLTGKLIGFTRKLRAVEPIVHFTPDAHGIVLDVSYDRYVTPRSLVVAEIEFSDLASFSNFSRLGWIDVTRDPFYSDRALGAL